MFPIDFTKRAVLVTGGARRIGRAICEELAARGYLVLVHSRLKDDADAMALAEKLGGLHFWADFQDADETAGLMDSILSDSRINLYGIVNNASIFSLGKTSEIPQAHACALLSVNQFIPSVFMKCFAEHLCESGRYGVVVNIGDSRVIKGEVYKPKTIYESTKHFFVSDLQNHARAFAPNMRVNVVAPGPVLAPVSPKNSEPGGKVLLSKRPTPKDVATAVAFLIGNESVTGQLIVVDSGQRLVK